MPTLKYRRLRGDMIETFKIIIGIYDKEVTERYFEIIIILKKNIQSTNTSTING